MGILEAVKKGFEIAGKSRNLVLVMFAFAFIWNLINIPFNTQLQEPNVGLSVSVIVLSIIFIALSIFMQSGSLGFVHEVIKAGQSNLTHFKNCGKKFYLRILGVSVIVGLFIVILSILATLAILIGGETPNAISIVLAVIIAAFGIYGVILVFLAPYIVVADDARVVDSLKASIGVVKSNFLKVVGIGVIMILIGFAVGLVLGLVFGLLGALLQGVAGQVVFGFLGSLVNAYLGVVVTAAFMSYYLSAKTSSEPAANP